MTKRYAVPVEFRNQQNGKPFTIIYYADNQENAELLVCMLRTLREKSGGQILPFSNRVNADMVNVVSLYGALTSCEVEQ